MNPGAQPDFAADRAATSSIASWSSSCGKRKSAAGRPGRGGLGPRDRAAAVELPVGQREDEDVGQPHLGGGEQQRVALVRRAADQRADQQHQRRAVGRGDEQDQGDGQPEQPVLPGHPAGVGRHQRDEQHQLQRRHDQPRPDSSGSGSSAYRAIATSTAQAAGSRGSPGCF